MAVPSNTCAECRALVAAAEMAAHLAWHSGLMAALANHPHGPVTPLRGGRGKDDDK
jgi:hypothetical protein